MESYGRFFLGMHQILISFHAFQHRLMVRGHFPEYPAIQTKRSEHAIHLNKAGIDGLSLHPLKCIKRRKNDETLEKRKLRIRRSPTIHAYPSRHHQQLNGDAILIHVRHDALVTAHLKAYFWDKRRELAASRKQEDGRCTKTRLSAVGLWRCAAHPVMTLPREAAVWPRSFPKWKSVALPTLKVRVQAQLGRSTNLLVVYQFGSK